MSQCNNGEVFVLYDIILRHEHNMIMRIKYCIIFVYNPILYFFTQDFSIPPHRVIYLQQNITNKAHFSRSHLGDFGEAGLSFGGF